MEASARQHTSNVQQMLARRRTFLGVFSLIKTSIYTYAIFVIGEDTFKMSIKFKNR